MHVRQGVPEQMSVIGTEAGDRLVEEMDYVRGPRASVIVHTSNRKSSGREPWLVPLFGGQRGSLRPS